MVIDVRKLNAKKEYSGDLNFSTEIDESLIGIPYVHFSSPVSVEVHFELYEDDSVSFFGKVKFTLVGKCSRCLNDAKSDVEGEIDALFELKKDCEDYSYQNGLIDLTDMINDAVMGCMPMTLSCGESCKGIDSILNK